MITIIVNNKSQDFEQHISVATLLSELKMAIRGIAVAVNNIVIPKTEWKTQVLNANDNVTIIRATQGG